ncbi:MAG: mechanosensitive ion channel [Bacteroidales bacterium]|nr:mechanosensitive ion channel [Bacteroidales bacterium]
MTSKEFLEYEIINTENFSLTVYDILITVVIFGSVTLMLYLIKRLFRRQEKRGKMDIGTSRAIFQIIKYIIWTVAVIMSLDTIGIRVTLLLASSAALLVGLGLGLQQIFQDFISGITLIIEGSLKVGDIVEIQNGEVGKVVEINTRTSKLESRDNIILIVPNSKLINDVVINWTHLEKKTRFKINVGVAYGSDVELVRKVLLKCAESHQQVSVKPPPNVRFTDFGDSSLDFQLLFFTTETFRVEDLKSDLRFEIDKAFRENNIKIPFPQRDVHLFKE